MVRHGRLFESSLSSALSSTNVSLQNRSPRSIFCTTALGQHFSPPGADAVAANLLSLFLSCHFDGAAVVTLITAFSV
jgi:hypothetical protein